MDKQFLVHAGSGNYDNNYYTHRHGRAAYIGKWLLIMLPPLLFSQYTLAMYHTQGIMYPKGV